MGSFVFCSLFFLLRARLAICLFLPQGPFFFSPGPIRQENPLENSGAARGWQEKKKKKERKNDVRSIIFFFLFDFILFTPLRIQTKRKKRSRIVIGQFLSLYTPLLRQVCPLLLSRSVSPSIYFLAIPVLLSEKKKRTRIARFIMVD